MATKSISIKAFKIKPSNVQAYNIDFQDILQNALDKSDNIESRFMPLSKQDIDQEGDFISYYDNQVGAQK